MGHTVTVEGSLTPCVELPRGVRRTVTVTDHVRRLVKRGYVVVVEGSLDAPVIDVDGIDDDLDGGDAAAANLGSAHPFITRDAPPRNASRVVWAEFLDNQEPPITYPDDAGRDELVHIWQQVRGGS